MKILKKDKERLMIDINEIYRLVELNKEIIIQIFRNKGYQYILIVDKVLMPVFEGYEDYVFTNVKMCKAYQGAMLCLEKSEDVLEIEKNNAQLDSFVLTTEYNRMKRQLKKVTKESVNAYKEMFGYSSIICEGEGECIKEIEVLKGRELSERPDALHITEYIDTRNGGDEKKECYTLGIRQFLYELEVLATFPEEIKPDLKDNKDFEKYVLRFCDIFFKTGWRVLFSEKTPLSEKIIKKCADSKVDYIENVQLQRDRKEKIIIVQNGNICGVERFYQENKYSHRLVSKRCIVLFRTWIMERLCAYFKDALAERGISLYLVNWNWAMNYPLFPQTQITSVELEERKKYNLYNIKGDLDTYEEFLKGIYGEKFEKEYVKQVFEIPNKVQIASGKIKHENKQSRYVNVINGERYTAGHPQCSENTVYMLGGCVFFGYAVEDCDTIASFLQKTINEKLFTRKWKVTNLGTWGGNIDQTYKQLYDVRFKSGDIVVVSYAGYMPLGENYEKWDISRALNVSFMNNTMYFNSIVHCNSMGYKLVAEKLFEMLSMDLKAKKKYEVEEFYLKKPKAYDCSENGYAEQARDYIDTVLQETPSSWKEGVFGAVVMNCNPFTLGHKYLICQAAKEVDYLYIFVVEEDKSFFPFKDRIKLVKDGTTEFVNVTVVPSGRLIISSVTFPGYFLKDSPDAVGVDTSLDVDIFARYIAGPLHITKRFVGEEPIDMVTRSYNESMKEILPRYGIELHEIPRKESGGGVISASRVRKALKLNDFETIKKLVPKTTLRYLEERKGQYLD